MQIDDEPSGGLKLTPTRENSAMIVAIVGAFLLALSRLPSDRTLAFAASTTLVGLILLAVAAVVGTATRTATLVRRVRRSGFIGTERGDGGSYREAARQGVVILDGETLEGPFRVEARLDRPSRGPASYKVYLVGARQLLIVGDVATAELARALVRRVESALGLPLAEANVERPFRFDDESPAALLLALGFGVAYLALAFALSHWLFARRELVTQREPIAPLILVPFGAVAYWAWSKVGADAACARLSAEFDLRR